MLQRVRAEQRSRRYRVRQWRVGGRHTAVCQDQLRLSGRAESRTHTLHWHAVRVYVSAVHEHGGPEQTDTIRVRQRLSSGRTIGLDVHQRQVEAEHEACQVREGVEREQTRDSQRAAAVS